tara:strand:- start:1582 stop:2391 length:810 start_codon:yes stop_codon:yes gene_type:complete
MLKQIKNSFEISKSNIPLLVAALFIDIIFVFIVFSSSALVFEDVGKNIYGISELFQEYNEKITDDLNAAQNVRAVLSDIPDFTLYYQNILKSIVIWFLTLYVLTSFFKGLNWSISAYLVKKKSFFKYYFRFFGVNILWFFISALLFFLSIQLSLKRVGSFVPVMSQNTIGIIILILFIIMIYFALISYGLLLETGILKSIRKCFVIGVKEWKNNLKMFGVVLGSLVLGFGLFYFIVNIHVLAGFLFGFVILLPLFYFLRIFIIESVQNG